MSIFGKNRISTIPSTNDLSVVLKFASTIVDSSNSHNKFLCQQAHDVHRGGPIWQISGFSNIQEFYQKLADCFGFSVDEIIFCTVNTHRIDMKNLLGPELNIGDFIFVHKKGNRHLGEGRKEIDITKSESENKLGISITDNGIGCSFIKKIRPGSVIDNLRSIKVGDHIEKVEDQSMVGWSCEDVTKYLTNIPVGKTFKMWLVEPLGPDERMNTNI